MISRYWEVESPPAAVDEQAEQSWRGIANATATLLAMEKRQLRQAVAALRKHPALIKQLREDDDKRTFEDASGDMPEGSASPLLQPCQIGIVQGRRAKT